VHDPEKSVADGGGQRAWRTRGIDLRAGHLFAELRQPRRRRIGFNSPSWSSFASRTGSAPMTRSQPRFRACLRYHRGNIGEVPAPEMLQPLLLRFRLT
jgi:hypothetical protein